LNVTEEMVCAVPPPLQDAPTSIRRFVLEPVVWLKVMELALATVPLVGVPDTVGVEVLGLIGTVPIAQVPLVPRLQLMVGVLP
jgi:hypothetical protein